MVRLVDASTLINVFATSRTKEIFEAQPFKAAISQAVRQETLGVNTDAGYVPIDLLPLMLAGSLDVWRLAPGAETQLYGVLRTQLGPGEAELIAMAVTRGVAVVSDDRKAHRIMANYGVVGFWTSDLIRTWAVAKAVAATDLKDILLRIERFAHFPPPKSDPNISWWQSALNT